MQINISKFINWLKLNFVLILVIITLILLLKSCGSEKSNLEIENAKLTEQAKTNKDFGKYYLDQYNESKSKEDSLKRQSVSLKQQNLVLEQTALKSLIALRNAQKRTTRPIYIKELQPCNDSLQKMYEYSIIKDSLCDKTITDKDSIIYNNKRTIKNDSITIALAERQKSFLENANEKNLMAIKILDTIILNDKKTIRNEKIKKNFWKVTTAGLGALILKMLLIK